MSGHHDFSIKGRELLAISGDIRTRKQENMALTLKFILTVALLLCLTAGMVSALPQRETEPPVMEDKVSTDMDLVSYTEAIPSSDFTLLNMSSTIEEVLAEAHIPAQTSSQTQTNTRSKRRPCACSTTTGAYGGRQGTAFVDVSTNACDVEITDIWVRHGSIVDAIQMRYNFSDGHPQTMPLRGGATGGITHVSIPQSGKVVGLFGGITSIESYGAVITQLRILVLDAQENLNIYGPFGTTLSLSPSTFAVYGNIKSIFGYYGDRYLNGLGVFYEPWGVCGSPCA